ncbi:shTK domain protein [Cooperia oncophora]
MVEVTDEGGEETNQTVTTAPQPTDSESATSEVTSPLPTLAQTSTRIAPIATVATPSPCLDKINPSTGRSDCPSRRNLCNHARYIQLMREHCPRTCGFCSSRRDPERDPVVGFIVHTEECVDRTNPRTGRSDCPNRRPLCQRNIYQRLMREQCPRTCGFCVSRLIRSKNQVGANRKFSNSASVQLLLKRSP